MNSLDHPMLFIAESCKWMSKECAKELLSEARPGTTRIGPYVYVGLLKSGLSSNWTAAPALPSQVSTFSLASNSRIEITIVHSCQECFPFIPKE